MNGPIRALLFDADEVIQYPLAGRNARLRSVFSSVPEPLESLIAQISDIEDTTLTGERDFRQALAPLLSRWHAQQRADAVLDWLTLVSVDEPVLDLIAACRRAGYRCLLATNQQPHRARFMAERLGYQAKFDRCFYSCAMGLAKPDPEYFRAVLNDLELAAQECLFVDDKPRNVAGARSVGIVSERFVNAKNGRAHLELAELLARHGVVPG